MPDERRRPRDEMRRAAVTPGTHRGTRKQTSFSRLTRSTEQEHFAPELVVGGGWVGSRGGVKREEGIALTCLRLRLRNCERVRGEVLRHLASPGLSQPITCRDGLDLPPYFRGFESEKRLSRKVVHTVRSTTRVFQSFGQVFLQYKVNSNTKTR